MYTFFKKHTKARGFTMFFAVLVSSLALAIGVAIYDLVVRELLISSTNEQSQYAVFAADTGAECALYWDSHYLGNHSIFATSSQDLIGVNSTGALCDGIDVAETAGSLTFLPPYATTTISFPIVISASPSVQYSTFVEVGKKTNPDGTTFTVILSHGYNTTNLNLPSAVEREFRVTY